MATITELFRELLNTPVYGNAYSDMPLFDLADEVIRHPEATQAQQLVAIRRIGEAMGEDKKITYKNVEDYIRETE